MLMLIGMNATMEAVLCLNLVAEKKGYTVDIKLYQKMAGAKVSSSIIDKIVSEIDRYLLTCILEYIIFFVSR